MVQVKIKNYSILHESVKGEGGYVVDEVDRSFSPQKGYEDIWKKAGWENLIGEKPTAPLKDLDILVTPSFSLPGNFKGILHLVLPSFSSPMKYENDAILSQCYRLSFEKAVEKDSPKLILPFLAVHSSDYPYKDAVDVALNAVRDFFNGTVETGLLEEIWFCSTHKKAFQRAIKHELYLNQKYRRDTSHPISLDTCLFSTIEPTIDAARMVHDDCNGTTQKLSMLFARDQSFGCAHNLELLLLRGGIQIDWDDEDQSRRFLEMSVCQNHKNRLLSKWKWNLLGNKHNFAQKLTCSLPQVLHKEGIRPVTGGKRLNKLDTLRLIESTDRFFHVGTAVCDYHEKAIRERKFHILSFSDCMEEEKQSMDDVVFQFSDMSDSVSEIQSASEHDSNSTIDSDVHLALPANALPVSEANRDTSEEQIVDAFRLIAKYYGLSRLTSKEEWDDLQPDSQRKKISSMIHIQEELYKLCAGSGWKKMRTACIKKIGLLVDDSRVTKILESIDERLVETTDRRSRLNLISVLTGHFSEKEITHATGVSRYYIAEAKKFALWGLDEVVNCRRVRYDLQIVKEYVSFISRPEVIVSMPKPGKCLNLSSGEALSVASVARLHSYRQVYNMYKAYLMIKYKEECDATEEDVMEFVRTHSLGYSTAVKIMETLIPVRRVRMQCVDSFQADAYEAFENALKSVEELKDKAKVADTVASELRRRFTVARNYLCGYFRMHLSISSTCASHCITYALSDSGNPEYRSECDHDHKDSCDQCCEILTVFSKFKAFLVEKAFTAHQNNDTNRYRLSRMVEETEEAEAKVFEFQKHIVRAAMSELDRINTIDSLSDGWAMLTLDFSLKLMPSGFVEAQSQWFGKCGISFHVTHVLTKMNGKQKHHRLGHVNDDPKQDCMSVCVIADHVFKVLSENGIRNIVARSDNAGNYRNAGVIFTLREIATKYGLTMSAYLFSEPQAGKGAADRSISNAKQHLVSAVNRGGYGRNAGEILKSFTTEPLLKAYSFYHIKGEMLERADNNINGITNLSSFRYEKTGVRVRKHDSIGEGQLISYQGMQPIKYKYKLLDEGGIMSKNVDFWGELGGDLQKKKENKKKDDEDSVVYEEENNPHIISCTVENCTAKFQKIRFLDQHLLIGKHKFPKHSDTVVEAAARMFSESVETNESAYQAMRVDSLSSSNQTTRSLHLKEGWAVRMKNQTKIIDPDVRRAARKYFIERRRSGKRAEAREIAQLIRDKTDPMDGAYIFPLKSCLKESQAQSLIGRFLKIEVKDGLNALESDVEDEEMEVDEDKEEGVCDLLEEQEFIEEEPAKKKSRGLRKDDQLSNVKKIEQTIMAKAANGVIKKLTAAITKKKKKKQSSDESEERERDDELPGPSTRKSPMRKGRPKKISSPEATVAVKPNSCGRNKKDISRSAIPPSTRVLRSQKRGVAEDKMAYCEVSSDEDVDDFTSMMNVINENHTDIFTDEE